jgi:uncharacterized protein (DUF2345 family)
MPHALAHGHTFTTADDLTTLEVRDATGTVELRIRVTADGPIVEVNAGRLALRAREAIELTSRRISLCAADAVEIDAGGDVRVVGATIYLN